MNLNEIDKNRIVALIQKTTEHLSESELLEEHGWEEDDADILKLISNTDFTIDFTV